MASRQPQEARNPSFSSLALPLGLRSRSGSIASTSSRSHVDRETFTQALDQIHSSASRSETLTTFNDFAPPPSSSSSNEDKGRSSPFAQGGLGGIYTRLRASVSGAGRDTRDTSPKPGNHDNSNGSLANRGNRPPPLSKQARISESPNLSSSTLKVASPSLKGSFSSPSTSHHAASSLDASGILASNTTAASDVARSGETTVPFPQLLSPTNVAADLATIVKSSSEELTLSGRLPKSPGVKPSTVLATIDDVSNSPAAGLGIPDVPGEGSKSPALANFPTKVVSSGETKLGGTVNNIHSELQSSNTSLVPVGKTAVRLEQQIPQFQDLPPPKKSRSRASDASESRPSNGVVLHPERQIMTTRWESISPEKHQNLDPPPSNLIYQMQKKVLSRDFWMKDENARVCFNCGDGFSTFRRKHHCSKPFGQASKLRVCKTCEVMMNGDDSSDYSEDDEQLPSNPVKQIRFSDLPRESQLTHNRSDSDGLSDSEKPATPNSGNSSSRRIRDNKRWSMSGVASDRQPTLPRPASSRSLKSLSGRPRSSSQKQRRLRNQHMRSLSVGVEDGAPFHQNASGNIDTDATLPAFHTDSIIDPDLVPFMSDEGSSEDEQPSIASALSAEVHDQSAGLQHGLLGALRRSRSQGPGKILPDASRARHDADNMSVVSSRAGRKRRQLGSRTVSVGSLGHISSSPRIIRSDNLFASSDNLLAMGQKSRLHVQLYDGLGHYPFVLPPPSQRQNEKPGADLNPASLDHVKKIFRQFLCDAQISNAKQWEKALVPILLRCAEQVDPNIHRGDDIDIRHYVKLKKAAGGSPSDTTYVSGVVFTKNVALKDMPRNIKNPRILVISFPLVYARHQQHFMSLEPIIAQEREYLRNLVNRIRALRPQVLLVQRDVSGLALQFLQEASIAVAYNVKPSVLQAVARCTQTRIVTSPERLTINQNALGRCESFDVKTYVHGSMKKTYIFLSGCQHDLGCTIVLRGADRTILSKLKWIAEFMCYVTYNMKLETCLMRDEFISTPSLKMLQSQQLASGPRRDLSTGVLHQQEGNDGSMGNRSTLNTLMNKEQPKQHTPVSDQEQQKDESYSFDGKDARWKATSSDGPYDTLVRECQQRLLSVSPFVRLSEPYLVLRGREQEQKMARLRRLQESKQLRKSENDSSNPQSQKFQLLSPDMIYDATKHTSRQVRDLIQAIHDAEYEKAAHRYNNLKRRWETYIAGVQNPFSPLTHQKILVLFSIVSTFTSDACEGPDLLGLDFYQEHEIDEGLEPDMPLGEFVERLCKQADSKCTAGRCDRKMIHHHRQYVHGEGQVSIYVQKYPSRFRGMENMILMWSCCRKCDHETQVTPMSSSSWKYSFGKYLELSFWSHHLHPRAGTCAHDIHRDHKRFFGFKDLAISVQYDPINIMEVTVPRGTITWGVEKDLRLKNEEYQRMEERLTRFMSSVKLRIKSINVESIAQEKAEDCKVQVEKLGKRAIDEYEELTRKLQEKYMSSNYYEIVPLNRAMRFMQEKVAEWDNAFADFERDYFPSEKDIRRLAALQFRKTFLEADESNSTIGESEEKTQPRQEEEHVQEKDQLVDVTENIQNAPLASPQAPTSAGIGSSEMIAQPLAKGIVPLALFDHGKQLVQSLDLAISTVSADFAAPPDGLSIPREGRQLAMNSSNVQAEGDDNSQLDTLLKPSPLPPAVAARVDQMCDARPEDSKPIEETQGALSTDSRRRSSIMAPPLFRAQTQPAPALKISSDLILDPEASPEAHMTQPLVSPSPIHFPRPTVSPPPLSFGKVVDRSRSGKSKIPRAIQGRRNESKVSALAKHFEEMSREFEKERLRERRQRAARTRQSRAYPLVASKPIVELFRDAHEAVRERESEPSYEELRDDSPDGNVRQSSETELVHHIGTEERIDQPTPRQQVETVRESLDALASVDVGEDNTQPSSYPASDAEGNNSDTEQPTFADTRELDDVTDRLMISPFEPPSEYVTEIPKHEKSSLIKMLTRFWSERSASGWTPLDYPLVPTDHIFADSDVIVREDEPSSLIAFALASQDYSSKLQNVWEKAKVNEKNLQSDHQIDAEIEQIMLGKTATHMKYQFQAGSARMLCKVFYAESFDAVRRKCGVADRFVESLSRCLKWDSKGGKTKSLFLKTLDERFVLKSLSPVETQAFLKFAPDYFDYLSKTLFHGLPSAIAKMLGFYQVVIKNPATGSDFNYFLQVMENVFYEGPSNRMFDLKGSMRNRRIQSTGDKDEVLLDENLLDYISSAPIYVRAHSNSILTSSISNDTLFCSKQNVMDYSLIVGLYDDRKELLVGVIDYIRTYTWDKKLESWIKDRGKHKPTVRSPKDYRNRFRASIPRYFPLAPSFWQTFGAQRLEMAQQLPWPVGGVGEVDDAGEERGEGGVDGEGVERRVVSGEQ